MIDGIAETTAIAVLALSMLVIFPNDKTSQRLSAPHLLGSD